jgi:hypothetical protein
MALVALARERGPDTVYGSAIDAREATVLTDLVASREARTGYGRDQLMTCQHVNRLLEGCSPGPSLAGGTKRRAADSGRDEGTSIMRPL